MAVLKVDKHRADTITQTRVTRPPVQLRTKHIKSSVSIVFVIVKNEPVFSTQARPYVFTNGRPSNSCPCEAELMGRVLSG